MAVCFTEDEFNSKTFNGPDETNTSGLSLLNMLALPADRFQVIRVPELMDSRTASAMTALSFKLINTSPLQERSGTLVSYEQTCTVSQQTLYDRFTNNLDPTVGTAPTIVFSGLNVPVVALQGPPRDLETAVALGAKVTPAPDGMVTVVPLEYSQMRPTTATGASFIFTDPNSTIPASDSPSDSSVRDSAAFAGYRVSSLSFENEDEPNNIPWQEYSYGQISTKAKVRRGCFVLDQSQAASYTMEVHVVISRVPLSSSTGIDVSIQDMLPYANTPPIFDQNFMDALEIAARELPISMAARDNNFGNFFKKALGTFSSVFKSISPITNSMPGRVGMLSRAVTSAMPVVNSIEEAIPGANKKIGRAHV